MAHDEAVVTQKFGKAASPPKDQPTLYPHPDWSTVQAYYGPGVFPPTYFAPAIAPGHAPPPYMWGPQPLMPPPFGAPYAAMYPHGGGYPHPLVPLMANPLTAEPAKSANNKEKSPNKKLKEIDGSAVSTGSGSSKIASGDYSAEGSIDGSDPKVTKTSNNQSLEDGLGADVEQNNAAKMEDVPAPNNTVGDPGKPASSSNPCFPSPLIKPHAANVCNVRAMVTPISTSPGGMVPGRNGVSTELTRDERELKRERRKQSNRESARRSRLRKQAETEELAMKVDSLIAENTSLRSEISRLTESSEKLRLENSALMEKLKDAAPSHAKAALGKVSVPSPVVMEKFLSIIEHKNTSGIGGHMEHGEPKLHQLLGSSPAADAVAAN